MTISTEPQFARASAPDSIDLSKRYWMRSPDRFLEVDGHRIGSTTVGQGPDLVFVHGWPLHSATFRHLVPKLAESYTCHLIDLPATGNTESPDHLRVSFVGHADIVRGCADALGLSRYGLIAHDSGGFIARRVAAVDSRVAALVSGNTEIPGHHPWQLGLYFTVLRAPFGASGLTTLMRSRALRRSALAFGPCFTNPDYIEGEFYDLFIAPLLSSPGRAADQLRAMKTLSFSDLDGLADIHARITAPVQMIWGAKDSFFPLLKARSMMNQFRGEAKLVEIPDGKLFCHEDHAAEFLDHALPFLARHMGK